MVELQRNLGLSAVFTVSLGAMIGSGIFVLPGLAAELAGPAVILAYLIAGLVVIPAAVSKSELATAMPRAGGAYLFIDRAMGPLVGTVAGFGVWFALVFKSAFALVGLGGYLLFFLDLPMRTVAVVLALALCAVNMVGVKQSGRFQTIVVFGVLAVLGLFILTGAVNIESGSLTPFLPEGVGGLLSATGLVFVSYAGVTKVASVSEEVKDPGSILPRGILWRDTVVDSPDAGGLSGHSVGGSRQPAAVRPVGQFGAGSLRRRGDHGAFRRRAHIGHRGAGAHLDGQRRVALVVPLPLRHGAQPAGAGVLLIHKSRTGTPHRQHRPHRSGDDRVDPVRAPARAGQTGLGFPGAGLLLDPPLADRLPGVQPLLVPTAFSGALLPVDTDIRYRRFPGAPHPARLDIDGRIARHRGGRGGLVPLVRPFEGQSRERHARHPAAPLHRSPGGDHPPVPLLPGA